MHFSNIGHAQDLETLIRAAGHLEDVEQLFGGLDRFRRATRASRPVGREPSTPTASRSSTTSRARCWPSHCHPPISTFVGLARLLAGFVDSPAVSTEYSQRDDQFLRALMPTAKRCRLVEAAGCGIVVPPGPARARRRRRPRRRTRAGCRPRRDGRAPGAPASSERPIGRSRSAATASVVADLVLQQLPVERVHVLDQPRRRHSVGARAPGRAFPSRRGERGRAASRARRSARASVSPGADQESRLAVVRPRPGRPRPSSRRRDRPAASASMSGHGRALARRRQHDRVARPRTTSRPPPGSRGTGRRARGPARCARLTPAARGRRRPRREGATHRRRAPRSGRERRQEIVGALDRRHPAEPADDEASRPRSRAARRNCRTTSPSDATRALELDAEANHRRTARCGATPSPTSSSRTSGLTATSRVADAGERRARSPRKTTVAPTARSTRAGRGRGTCATTTGAPARAGEQRGSAPDRAGLRGVRVDDVRPDACG